MEHSVDLNDLSECKEGSDPRKANTENWINTSLYIEGMATPQDVVQEIRKAESIYENELMTHDDDVPDIEEFDEDNLLEDIVGKKE